MCQPFVALPDLLTHSWQVFLKPRKIRDATVLALRVCKTRRTRACKADFPSGFLLACRSLRSKARSSAENCSLASSGPADAATVAASACTFCLPAVSLGSFSTGTLQVLASFLKDCTKERRVSARFVVILKASSKEKALDDAKFEPSMNEGMRLHPSTINFSFKRMSNVMEA